MPICYNHPPARRSADPGVVSPANGGYAADTLGDPFGERNFSTAFHASGVDFHRGYDTLDNEDGPGEPADSGGMPIYSPICGTVIRKFYGHFSWFDAGNMSQNTEVDPNSKATFSASAGVLTVTGKNNGTVTFPSGIAQLQRSSAFRNDLTDNDWLIMIMFDTPPTALTGKIVLGIYDATNDEYACLEYDGATFTVKGKDAGGVMTADGTTAAASGKKYMRVRWSVADAKLYWDYSADATTWTSITNEGTITWTNAGGGFKSFVGWDPAAAGGDDTVTIKYSGGGDSASINRFGNWVQIANASRKWVLLHFRHISANVGDVVRAGQQLGISGRTGFDIRSGPIIENHLHTELHLNNGDSYSNADPINPYSADASIYIPRSTTAPSISVVQDSATDPYGGGVDCHRITVTVTRGTWNNFQINEFRIVGNLATRTLNWNTRAGLDPADNDANNYDGCYFEPVAFDETSASYIFKYYASKAVVGATWSSGYVKDSDGNTLWSG